MSNKISGKYLQCLFMCLFPCMLSAQPVDKLVLCCAWYGEGLLKFSAVNKADSTLKISFENIERIKGKDMLRSYQLVADTLQITLSQEKKEKINSSGNLKYQIDGTPYYQRILAPNEKRELYITLKKAMYKKVAYLAILNFNGGIVAILKLPK